MNNVLLKLVLGLLTIAMFVVSCKEDTPSDSCATCPVYDPTPYVFELPAGLPPVPVPADNPMTEEGVELGRMLFYDPILSADSSLSCGGCHGINKSFTDEENVFSIGIDGIAGERTSMPLVNLAWAPYFFWDARAATIEIQALLPIENPIEMHALLPDVISKLQNHLEYPDLFYGAFGDSVVSETHLAKAIAQFERTLISVNSRFDQARRGEIFLTDDEQDGFELFNDLFGADCMHCHGENAGLFTDFTMKNNGLDDVYKYTDFADPGFGGVSELTTDTADYGKFKVPSLRNIELTAPYMHDGRFETLEEVVDFYSEGINDTPFTDGLIEFAFQGGVQLTDEDKAKVVSFMKSLTDTSFINNPAFQNPFE